MEEMIGTRWYEDYKYGGAKPATAERMNGRIVEVVDVVGDDHLRIRNVGGTHAGKTLGRETTVKLSRFNKAGGYRPFPPGWVVPEVEV